MRVTAVNSRRTAHWKLAEDSDRILKTLDELRDGEVRKVLKCNTFVICQRQCIVADGIAMVARCG